MHSLVWTVSSHLTLGGRKEDFFVLPALNSHMPATTIVHAFLWNAFISVHFHSHIPGNMPPGGMCCLLFH